jgi:hypothetical protein
LRLHVKQDGKHQQTGIPTERLLPPFPLLPAEYIAKRGKAKGKADGRFDGYPNGGVLHHFGVSEQIRQLRFGLQNRKPARSDNETGAEQSKNNRLPEFPKTEFQ